MCELDCIIRGDRVSLRGVRVSLRGNHVSLRGDHVQLRVLLQLSIFHKVKSTKMITNLNQVSNMCPGNKVQHKVSSEQIRCHIDAATT